MKVRMLTMSLQILDGSGRKKDKYFNSVYQIAVSCKWLKRKEKRVFLNLENQTLKKQPRFK